VSFEVRPGEIVGLIGPNGAGKTTIIDAITGFVRAESASVVRLGEVNVVGSRPAKRARQGLGRSFQSVELFDDLSVLENLLVACDEHGAKTYLTDLVRTRRTTIPQEVLDIVEAFGLQGDLEKLPEELPFGRRRLVAVARTVSARPSVLLLDEPAAGLSDSESRHLGEVIVALARKRGLAVLMIEHDVALVKAICDRIIVLDFGRKLAEGTPDEVTSNALVIAAYVGEPDEALDAFAAEPAS
jgi:sulfate-transporting ATPase